MQIIVGKTAGFCFGVKNAVTKATEELNKSNSIYCLGELVHNTQVTEELIEKGMKFVENIDEAKDKVIIRSHGVTKDTYEKAKNKNIKLVDLTCPKVLKIHNIVEEYSKKNYYIILIGDKNHPEVMGNASFCGNDCTIIEGLEEVERALINFKKSNKENVVVISQTTYSMEKFNIIVEEIKEKVPEENLEIKNTICNATKERQEETKKIASKVDLMIIIGGKHSSNSNKLYELSKKYCKNVLFVETYEELMIDEIKKMEKIGIMAGASTPQKSIEKVIEKLEKM